MKISYFASGLFFIHLVNFQRSSLTVSCKGHVYGVSSFVVSVYHISCCETEIVLMHG